MQRESVFTNGVCPLGGDASCGCPSYLCWMLSSGTWRGSRGCSDGDSSFSAGDTNHSSAWSLLSFTLSHVSSPSTTGLPPRPHTAPQTGSRSPGSSGLKSPWPPASSLRCSSEIANKHHKDVTLFTVYVVRRFDAQRTQTPAAGVVLPSSVSKNGSILSISKRFYIEITIKSNQMGFDSNKQCFS